MLLPAWMSKSWSFILISIKGIMNSTCLFPIWNGVSQCSKYWDWSHQLCILRFTCKDEIPVEEVAVGEKKSELLTTESNLGSYSNSENIVHHHLAFASVCFAALDYNSKNLKTSGIPEPWCQVLQLPLQRWVFWLLLFMATVKKPPLFVYLHSSSLQLG